jgi:hypothetical protein
VNSNIFPTTNGDAPNLAEAALGLEELIANQVQKVEVAESGNIIVASTESFSQDCTHCAVNANALFELHVDRGHGAGQSLSLVVGLGEVGRGASFQYSLQASWV